METLDIELDGHIYLIQKAEDGKILSKTELDGDAIVKALLKMLEKSMIEE